MKILMIDLDECSEDCFEQIDSKYDLLTELNAECYGKVYTDTKEFEKPPSVKRDYKGGIIENAIDVTTRTAEECMLREQGLMPELNDHSKFSNIQWRCV